MARNSGRKKSLMIPKLIKPAASHLGTYCCIGDTQHMFFTDNDAEPFWMVHKKESSIDLTGKRLLRALKEGKKRKSLLTKNELIELPQIKVVEASGNMNHGKWLCAL
jgi:hypothetical protein